MSTDPATPEGEVQQVLEAVAQLRARHAAFTAAARGIRAEQCHRDVQARWDTEGNLLGIDIAPTALRDYTNLELEDIVAEVLRRTRLDVGEKFQALFDTYLGFDTARFDPDVLGVPLAPLLRSFGGGG